MVASIRAQIGCSVARAAASDGRPALTAGHAAAARRLAARTSLLPRRRTSLLPRRRAARHAAAAALALPLLAGGHSQ